MTPRPENEPTDPDPVEFDEDLPPELDPELLEETQDDEAEEADEDATTDDPEAAPAKKKTPKAAEEEEEEEEVQHPDTPVPSMKEMRAALDWAFESEDDVTPELLDLFAQHARLVLEKNRVMNLTTIIEPREVAAKHFLDSWRTTRLVPLMARKVLDLGTGAGFPGIPVALAEPNLSMMLVDSTKKKIDFLDEVIAALGLKNTRTEWARAEDYLAKNSVDVVLVRAVSSVRENVRTLRKVRHSLKDLVMLKAQSWSREMRAGEREAERLGFKLDTVWEHELPGDMGGRAILVYRAPGGAGT